MGSYRDDLLELCERRFLNEPNVVRAQMMGHPGFKLEHNNKFFLFVYEDGLTLKMPPDHHEEFVNREDTTGFQPGGMSKPMSTWVNWIRAEAGDYEKEWEFVDMALRYTSSEPPNERKKRKNK